MRALKAAKVRPAFVTAGLELGGSTTFLLNIARGLKKKKIPFLICSLESYHPMRKDFKELNDHIEVMDDKKQIFEDRMQLLLEKLHEFQPTHVIGTLGASSLEVFRYLPVGIGRIGMIQSDDPGPYGALRLYQKHTEAVAGVSRRIIIKLKNDSVLGKKKVGDVRYGVNMPPLRKKRAIFCGQRPLRILYCGRIVEEQKRISLLPLILKDLDKAGLNYEMTMAGKGCELNKMVDLLQTWVRQKKVYIIGGLDQKAVSKTMAKNDIFLLFSNYEGLPLALLEGMAHGLVPVVSDLGNDFRDLVHGTGGKLVNHKATKDYAKAILEVAKRPNSFFRNSILCQRKCRDDYSIEAMTNRWIGFLKQIPTTNKEKDFCQRISKIQCPLALGRNILYHPLLRPLRRLSKKRIFG
jgi:colanic acid/amylovoran biosynthesis glycosyltransferase